MRCFFFFFKKTCFRFKIINREGGTHLKGVGNNKYGIIASSKGYSKGKHTWKIQNISGGYGYWFPAILTNSNCQGGNTETKHIYNNTYKGTSYFYWGSSTCLTQYVNGSRKDVISNIPTWKKGEVVTILLDCDLSKIGFWNGEKKLGVLQILPNETYYPGFELYSNPQNEFKLMKA